MNFLDLKSHNIAPVSVRASLVGIRPEHLRFCPLGTGLCDAEVAFFEELGAETLVHLRCQNGEKYILRLESATPPPALATSVGLTAAEKYRFFFDNNGKRLKIEALLQPHKFITANGLQMAFS